MPLAAAEGISKRSEHAVKRKTAKARLLNMLTKRKTLHFKKTVMSIMCKAL